MLRAKLGIVRRALSEPSIGSITTRAGSEPSPKSCSPRSSEIAVKRRPLRMQRLELGEHDRLGVAVDHQRAIAALADADVLGPRADRANAREQLRLGCDHPPTGLEPGVDGRSRGLR